jgi:hypothetical protein
MTEYSVASPFYSSTHSFNRFQAEMPYADDTRSNPFLGACRAVRTSIEQFEAALDGDHEVAIHLASFGTSAEFHATHVCFSPSNVITFLGQTSSGEKVQFVQHVSQVSLLLKSVRKLHETATRLKFQHAAS